MKFMASAARIDLAVGPDSITAFARHGSRVQSHTTPLSGDDVIAALPAAFTALRAQLDAALGTTLDGVSASVVLLPPLAETRLITLPPLRAAETEAIVRRDAGRYFMSVPAPRLVGVARGRQAGAPVMAAAASAALVDALRAAGAGAGWRIDSITAAHAAWSAAGRAATASDRVRDTPSARDHARTATARDRADGGAGAVRDTDTAVVAVERDTAHIIQLANGAPVVMRRVPAAETTEVLAAAGAAPARVVILAAGRTRDALAAAFSGAAWTIVSQHVDATEAAARHAAGAALRIVPAGVITERRASERRVAVRLAVAAVLLLAATAALELWGANRELDAVRGRRAEIRAQVAPLLDMRDSIDRIDARTLDIEALARATPRWTPALFDIAMLLPVESYLTRLNATGDTIVIEAEGARAGTVLQAFRHAAALRDARLIGTVDRELADGLTTVERFTIAARLAPRTADTTVATSGPRAAGAAPQERQP